jgi:hypothetical protein
LKKRILLMAFIMLIQLACSGCSDPSPSRTVVKDVPEEIKEASRGMETADLSEGQSGTSTALTEGLPGASPPSSLIVKSDNAVTEAERMALLNALTQELDTLIQLLDELESVEDADLDLSGFE